MKRGQEITLILNIALILGVVLGDICYMSLGTTVIKGVTSGLFVLLGMVNLTYVLVNHPQNFRFPLTMVVGLVFAMLGDILLNIEFTVGAILFAIGHVCYFLAYTFNVKFQWRDLFYGLALFVPAFIFIMCFPLFKFGGAFMQSICVFYALIISVMVGKAMINCRKERNCRNVLILIGSLLFFFSDLMLLLNVFGDLPKFVDLLCLATYYPAQCCLAYAITQD